MVFSFIIELLLHLCKEIAFALVKPFYSSGALLQNAGIIASFLPDEKLSLQNFRRKICVSRKGHLKLDAGVYRKTDHHLVGALVVRDVGWTDGCFEIAFLGIELLQSLEIVFHLVCLVGSARSCFDDGLELCRWEHGVAVELDVANSSPLAFLNFRNQDYPVFFFNRGGLRDDPGFQKSLLAIIGDEPCQGSLPSRVAELITGFYLHYPLKIIWWKCLVPLQSDLRDGRLVYEREGDLDPIRLGFGLDQDVPEIPGPIQSFKTLADTRGRIGFADFYSRDLLDVLAAESTRRDHSNGSNGFVFAACLFYRQICRSGRLEEGKPHENHPKNDSQRPF